MKLPIQISDNNWEGMLIDDEFHLANLMKIAEKPIAQLNLDDNPNLLIFPQNFNEYGDKIGNQYVFELNENKLCTGNIMGFIGYRDTKVRIHSRFSQSDGKDYFLHYMLQKVFALNIFDLKFHADEESIFDFLIYLFPTFLKRAMRQGLFKEYQTRHYNDANVRGRIDVNRHIRMNIPFAGRIAYSTREYAYDNHIIQLVRHTIEYISNHPYSGGILQNDEQTKDAVSLIREATPTYSQNERRKVINQNVRPVSHPYYSEYRNLQRLCMQILRHEELKYGRKDDEIYGVLFDGAWLWEEYLYTILKDCGFTHPQNKLFKGRINLFKDRTCPRYPDFYKDDFVLDAKYKGYGNTEVNQIGGDDLHQLITYMYRLRTSRGGFVVPLKQNEFAAKAKELDGYGGWLGVYGLSVELACNSYKDYVASIEKQELLMKQEISQLI